MKKLFATYHAGKWWVSSDRLSGYAPVAGEGHSLPGAYLNYLRAFERVDQRNKSTKAEEQRCIDAIISMQLKCKIQPPTNQEHILVSDPPSRRFDRGTIQVIADAEPSKHWWQFWK